MGFRPMTSDDLPLVRRWLVSGHGSAFIRAYEKAGFEKAGMVETPDDPALLMVRNA